MNITSRTPEGEPNRCPVCGRFVRLTPSQPLGDAPCPHCGVLLWFFETETGQFFRRKPDVSDRLREGMKRSESQGSLPDEHQRVRIIEGTFEGFEGEVEVVDRVNRKVTVTIDIFGRVTPVEVGPWQLKAM